MKTLLILGLLLFPLVTFAEDWHVKTVTKDGRRASVVFHIPVPVGNNSATPAMSWRDALAEYIKPDLGGGIFGTWFSRLQGIDAGELGQLQAGELFEVSKTVTFKALDSDLQKRNKIDAHFTALSTSELSRLQSILTFWGFARDVP